MNFKPGSKLPTENKPYKLNVVLYEPEIAGNVGSIMRTCVAANAKLHLIEPLGFFLDDRFIKRASANYWPYLRLATYYSWEQFINENQDGELFFLTRYGKKAPSDIDFKVLTKPIYLVFGKESTGVDKKILKANLSRCLRLPMSPYVRSLNVANTTTTIVYEVLRQLGYPNLSKFEIQKGADFLKNYSESE